jgi:hypothetical protein
MYKAGRKAQFTLAAQPAAAAHAAIHGPLAGAGASMTPELPEPQAMGTGGGAKRDRLARLLLVAQQSQQR